MFGISDIIQLGVPGFSIFLFYLLASKHISANTRAISELTNLMKELAVYIKDKK